jgi:hypothetical protein
MSMDAMRPLFDSIQEPLLRDLFLELSDAALNAKLEAFLDRASWHFSAKLKLYETVTEEHDLEYTRLHRQYQDLIEGVVDAFCERAGTTQARLVDLCEEAASGADPVADAMVDLFVASSDYRVFVSMCVERAKLNAPPSRQPEGKDDDGGKEDDYKRESK